MLFHITNFSRDTTIAAARKVGGRTIKTTRAPLDRGEGHDRYLSLIQITAPCRCLYVNGGAKRSASFRTHACGRLYVTCEQLRTLRIRLYVKVSD